MRMWCVDPKLMCRNHLLGEHLECHMFFGALQKGQSLAGYLRNGLLDPYKLKQRHDELVEEMQRRNWNHRTPLPEFSVLPGLYVSLCPFTNLNELNGRCEVCSTLQERHALNMPTD